MAGKYVRCDQETEYSLHIPAICTRCPPISRTSPMAGSSSLNRHRIDRRSQHLRSLGHLLGPSTISKGFSRIQTLNCSSIPTTTTDSNPPFRQCHFRELNSHWLSFLNAFDPSNSMNPPQGISWAKSTLCMPCCPTQMSAPLRSTSKVDLLIKPMNSPPCTFTRTTEKITPTNPAISLPRSYIKVRIARFQSISHLPRSLAIPSGVKHISVIIDNMCVSHKLISLAPVHLDTISLRDLKS